MCRCRVQVLTLLSLCFQLIRSQDDERLVEKSYRFHSQPLICVKARYYNGHSKGRVKMEENTHGVVVLDPVDFW